MIGPPKWANRYDEMRSNAIISAPQSCYTVLPSFLWLWRDLNNSSLVKVSEKQ